MQLNNFKTFGFTGSRFPLVSSLTAVHSVIKKLPPAVSVLVGCASGIDKVIRSSIPSALVFSAASYPASSVRASFALRSIAFIKALAVSPAPVLLAFPSGICPAGLSPASDSLNCFNGSGSGTWASVCYAAGLGVPVFVFMPAGIHAPAFLVPLSAGWHIVQGVSVCALF